MTPLQMAQQELDNIDRITGVADIPYWKPLYEPPVRYYERTIGPKTVQYLERERKRYGGATLPTIEAILKDTYKEFRQ